MKSNFKRLVALILSVMMVTSLLPVSATADTAVPTDISRVNVGKPASGSTYYYTGEPVEPYFYLYEGSYNDLSSQHILREGIDYIVTYEDNVYPHPENGAYTLKAIITGIGDYTGTRTETFSFKYRNISTRLTSIVLDETIYDYTGEPICPKPHVYFDGRELTESIDYAIEYSGNVDVSENTTTKCGQIKIVGMGGFTGSTSPESAYFWIAPPIETVDTVSKTLDNGDSFSWSINEEGLLRIDVHSHDGEGIDLPNEAEIGFQRYYDEENRQWVYAPGYRDYAASTRKVKITGDVSAVSGFSGPSYLFLTEVELPDGVTTIRGSSTGAGSFGNLRNLRKINIPDSVTTIETNALSSCPNLSVDLPDGITYFNAGGGEAGQRGTKFFVTLNSTTEQTLKARSEKWFYIKGYPDFNLKYMKGGGSDEKVRTLVHYIGTNRDVVIPDFVEAISGAYQNTYSVCPVSIHSEVIPGSVRWLDHMLGDEADLKRVEIKPGALRSLPNNFLGYGNGVTISLPETIETLDNPNPNDFCYSHGWVLAEVVEGSFMHNFMVKSDKWREDDGSGVEPRYRIKSVIQPSVDPSMSEVRTDTLSDVHASKNDGSFTFDSLIYNGEALAEGTDYIATDRSLTVTTDCLERLGTGLHEFTLHYTGTAKESDASEEVITPVDPVWTVNYIARSVPVLTITGNEGADITDQCTVVWKTTAGAEVEQPVSVSPGTQLTVTVTPNDSLKIDGVQYYTAVTQSETLNDRTQPVNVVLGRQGTVTLAPKSDGADIPNNDNAGYTIKWYTENDGKYTQVGTGATSPMAEADTTLYCDITMTKQNRDNYPDLTKIPVPIPFGSVSRDVDINAKNNITLNISGTKKDGSDIKPEDYTVYWYKKTEDGFVPSGLPTGSKLLNLAAYEGEELYYEIAPADRYVGAYGRVRNWTQFHGVPASDATKITVTDKPQSKDIVLEKVKEVEITGTVTNGVTVGDSLTITATQNPFLGFTCGASYMSYAEEWNNINFLTQTDGNAVTFRALVNDLETTVKASDKNGNFQAAYQTQQKENLDVPFSMTMEDETLPSEINMTIYRQYPVAYGDGYEVYFITDRTPQIFYDMSFTLKNETKGVVIDPSLYSVTPQKVKFNDVSALAGVILMHDKLTLTATIPANDIADENNEQHPVHAVPVIFTDSLNISRNYGDMNNQFTLSYKEYGNIWFRTATENSRTVESYALYDSNGDLADCGETWAQQWHSTAQVPEGRYTLAVWKKAGWVSAPSTLEGLQSILDDGEYQTANVLIEDGKLCEKAELGASNDIRERKLFDEENTAFSPERVETSINEWTQIRLNYKVDESLVIANPDDTYAITVNTTPGALVGTNCTVLPRYETAHGYGVKMTDKYINHYAEGKLQNSVTLINYADPNHLGTVRGFTLYTDKPEGTVCFDVMGDKGGDYRFTTSADRLNKQGKKMQTGSAGEMTLSISANNAKLSFASDYLRTSDNNAQCRDAKNRVWVFTTPNCPVELYMDDVKIDSHYSSSTGAADFKFKMDDSKIGTANTSQFRAADPNWSLYGTHKLYTVTTVGGEEMRSVVSVMECVAKTDFTPAVINYLSVSGQSDWTGDPFNGREQRLMVDNGFQTWYYSLSAKGTRLSYTFTAEVEDANNFRDDAGLMIFATAQDGTEYSAVMERVGNTNTFKGTISDERLFFSGWAVSVNSKLPDTDNSPVTNAKDEEAVIDALGRSTVINDLETGEETTVGAYYDKLCGDLESAGEEQIRDSYNYLYDVFTEYFRSMQDVYGELPDGWIFDGSQESIDTLYKYLGYTFGTAADVDYESWDDYSTVITADGSECRNRTEYVYGNDGILYYTSWSVILPKDDEDEGWSQIRRVEIIEGDGDVLPTAKRGTNGGVIMTSGLDDLARWSPQTTQVLNNSANILRDTYKQITGKDHVTNIMAGGIRGDMLNGGGAFQQEGKAAGRYLQSLKNILEQSNNLPPETVNTLQKCFNNAKDINSCHTFGSLLDAAAAAANGMLEVASGGTVKASKKAIELVMAAFKAKYGEDIPLSYSDAAILAEKLFTQTWSSKAEAEIYMDAIAIEQALRAAGIRIKGGILPRSSVRNVSEASSRAVVDPSGVIYEAVLSNPVEGATATLYERLADGSEVQWNAEDYGQINPQVTNETGYYSWMVPEGEWQVRVTAPQGSNLQNNTSADNDAANLNDGSTKGWLPVKPEQLGINIPLVSTKTPALEDMSNTTNSVTLEFSMYMDVSTITGKTVKITDGTNNISCTITFPDKEADPANESKEYAKTAVIATNSKGGFEKGVEYTVSLTNGVKAYNGKALKATSKTFMIDVDKTELKKVIEAATSYHNEIKDGYPEIAAELKIAIDAAQSVYNKARPTDKEMLNAKNDVNAAVKKAKADRLAADKKAFNDYKTAGKNEASKLAKSDDSAASKKLIENAKNDIDKLTYDESLTVDENKARVDAIIAQLKKDLDAQRKADKRTVKFNTDGGTKINDVTVTTGFTITKPNDPTKDGYTFDGWFTSDKFETKFDFNSPVTENITIYAKFTKNTYSATWEWTGFTKAKVTLTCDNNPKLDPVVKEVTPEQINRTEPTCDNNGKAEYKASFDYDGKTYTDTKTETLAKTGHSYGKPAFKWDGYEKAVATFTCANDKSHVKTVTAEITNETTPATCEKDGETVYTATVTFEGKTCTDAKTETIEKTGHKWSEPVWTWDGVSSATATFTCEKDGTHVESVTDSNPTTETADVAHCEYDITIYYEACVTFEGETYYDSKGIIEPKTGHYYSGEPEWTWDGFDKATAAFECGNCYQAEQADAVITCERTEPTCESDGKAVYTATVTFKNKTYTDTKTETLAKTGHDWGKPEFKWNGYQTVIATFTCKNGGSHYENVNAAVTSKTTEATCESDGKTVYTAAVEFEGKTYTDTKTETIKKTGHSYKLTSWDWVDFDKAAATFTCEHDESHTKTIDADITSEITDDGYTIYTANAEFEGEVYTDSKTKDPLGLLGDVDGDGNITSADALTILRASAGLSSLSPEQTKLADVDGDGNVTSADALLVLRHSAGLSSNENIGKPIAA